jgi:flagellar capping protein FliD
MINDLMVIEKQPLTRLTKERDDITVKKTVYTDLKNMLDGMQSATKALISTDTTCAFTPGRTTNVSAGTNLTVLTATAESSTAATSYALHVDKLATAHTVKGTKQASMDGELGMTGTITLGGAGSLTAPTLVSGTVDAFDASQKLTKGQNELATGSYFIETMNDAGTWKYRMVDSTGSAVSISDGTPTGFSSDWQAIPVSGGTIDTGRGLTFDFGADSGAYQEVSKGSGAAQVTYTAGRANIEVSTSDSLVDIASFINHIVFPEGREVVATIIDSQLILAGKNTGADNLISVSDQTGSILQSLGILNAGGNFISANTPQNAEFTVNGFPIIRSSNTGLKDVIGGVTLNLAIDAEGQNATLNILSDTTTEKNALYNFMDKFNTLVGYLTGKLATVKQADETYKRGSLAGDSSLYGLRLDLTRLMNSDVQVGGTLKGLRQLGISMDENFKLSISDPAKLEDALKNNKANVIKLIDSVMTNVDKKVGRFTGKTGYVTSIQTSLEQMTKNKEAAIVRMNERLSFKEKTLLAQFTAAQSQIEQMTNQMSQMKAFFSNIYG